MSLEPDKYTTVAEKDTVNKYIPKNYIEDITRWREDMNFIFEWQNTNERSE